MFLGRVGSFTEHHHCHAHTTLYNLFHYCPLPLTFKKRKEKHAMIHNYKIYLPVTLECVQEFVLATFHSFQCAYKQTQ